MKKILLATFLIIGTLSSIKAGTFSDQQDFMECKLNSPVETTLCAGVFTAMVYNTPVETTDLPIPMQMWHEMNDAGGLAFFDWVYCNGSPCSSTNIVTQDLNGWGIIVGEVAYSGVFNSPGSLAVGSHQLRLWNAPSAGGDDVTCRWHGSTNCTLLGLVDVTDGGTLVVTAPSASVNLNIGMWLEKLKAKMLALLPLVENAYAQTQAISTTTPKASAVLVANVNLNDAQIVRVSDDDYRVTFSLTSKGERQEDVVYRVSFSDEKKNTVHAQSFDTVLALQKNRPAFINEKLILPEGFSGTFDVYVHAFTKAGLPLGVGVAGKITLESNPVPSLSSCSINAKEYRTSETLPVTCVISSPKPISSYDANGGGYVVISRAFYGNEPLEKMKSSGEIISNKSTQSLRGFDTPGTYAIRTRLETRSGIPSGKEAVNTFTVNGTAARIMNIMLDKNSYERNEVAKGTLSASMFTTESGKLFKLKASLSGKNGLCARELEQELNRKSALELFFDIDKRCVDPIFSVAITDERGNLLAQKSLGLESERLPMSSGAKALLAVILLGVIAYLARHEKLVSYLKKKAKRKK